MNFSRTFLVAALLSCHLVTHAQELSLRLHNVSVKQAMTELEHKSGYSFVYEGSDVNTSEVVRRYVKKRTFFFYAQSPDFHKPRLCYYLKILYL